MKSKENQLGISLTLQTRLVHINRRYELFKLVPILELDHHLFFVFKLKLYHKVLQQNYFFQLMIRNFHIFQTRYRHHC